MQQAGFEPSQPVGQAAGHVSPLHPPKQRGMLFESSLQTALLPSQQFWDAGTFEPSMRAPQMLPGGLQAVPLSQVFLVSVHVTW
jgi:hypothetical protein